MSTKTCERKKWLPKGSCEKVNSSEMSTKTCDWFPKESGIIKIFWSIEPNDIDIDIDQDLLI